MSYTAWTRTGEAARELGITVIEEAPFRPVGETVHRRNLEMIKEADLVLLGNILVGPVNLKNLEAAAAALEAGKELLVCNFTPFSSRDFTSGEGRRSTRGCKPPAQSFWPARKNCPPPSGAG